jgi:hypothetical protein
MITVYVWDFRGKDDAWGHASMQCDNTYISWWPEGEGRVRSNTLYQVQSKFPNKYTIPAYQNIYSAYPFRHRTKDDDEYAESEIRGKKRPPDHTIRISGLDEKAIKDWWESFGLVRDTRSLIGPLPPWSTLSQNCSTIVATALSKGGGDQYADWVKSWNLVWTPTKVKEYAYSIMLNLSKQPSR